MAFDDRNGQQFLINIGIPVENLQNFYASFFLREMYRVSCNELSQTEPIIKIVKAYLPARGILDFSEAACSV